MSSMCNSTSTTTMDNDVLMTKEHKEIFREYRKELIDNMDPDDDLLNQLHAARVLRHSDLSRIKEKGTVETKNASLLDILIRKPDRAFSEFIKALRESDQNHVANIISKNKESTPTHKQDQGENIDISDMAGNGASLQSTSRKCKDNMVYDLDDVDGIVNNAKPALLRRLSLDTWMESLLRKADVITESLEDDLQTGGMSSHTKVNRLLDDLKMGPIERFLHFCRIMKEDGRYHIVKILDVNMDDIYAQLGMEPPKPQSSSPENNNLFSCGIPPWVKEHPNANKYLFEDEGLKKKLIEAAPRLKQLVRTKDLWAFLQRYHLMDDMMVEQCQVGTRGEHVEAILKNLREGEVWRTHAFFRSLAQIDQAGLIELVLGPGSKELYMENLLEK